MKNIAGINTTKPRSQVFVDAFVQGTPGPATVYNFKELSKLPEEDLIIYGILAGSGEVYKWCQKEKKDFYYVDHSYFANGYVPPHWFRITKNNHVQNKLKQNVSSDRYEKFFKRDIKPWNKKGKDILVLPPTHAIQDFFDVKDWLDKTLDILKGATDRNIVVREKPFNPKVIKDRYGCTVVDSSINWPTNHQPPIDWLQYHAVVTYNSNTVIDALHNGVPVFCDERVCAAAPISETDFSKIETPKYDDRMALFSSLAYGSFNMSEMQNGDAWRLINES